MRVIQQVKFKATERESLVEQHQSKLKNNNYMLNKA